MIVYSLKFDEDFVLRLSVVVVENFMFFESHYSGYASAAQ